MKLSFSILVFWIALAAAPMGLRAQGELDRQAAQLQEQGPALQAFLQRSRQGQVDPAFASEVLTKARALEEQGLPAEPYLQKANEGLAKRVPPRKMEPALRNTDGQIRSAAGLADEAVKRGASASPDTRRRAILQFQSEMKAGRSARELDESLREGMSRKPHASLEDLADETSGRKPGKKVEKEKPVFPRLEYSPGGEKPVKATPPEKKKASKEKPPQKSSPTERGPEKSKHGIEKKEKPHNSTSSGSHGNSKGKGGGKGHGK